MHNIAMVITVTFSIETVASPFIYLSLHKAKGKKKLVSCATARLIEIAIS